MNAPRRAQPETEPDSPDGEGPRPEPDAKQSLERALLDQAVSSWRGLLDEDALEGLELAVELLIDTHPAMQAAIEQLAHTAHPQTSPAPQLASGVVTAHPDRTEIASTELTPPGRSGVVAKAPVSPRKRTPRT